MTSSDSSQKRGTSPEESGPINPSDLSRPVPDRSQTTRTDETTRPVPSVPSGGTESPVRDGWTTGRSRIVRRGHEPFVLLTINEAQRLVECINATGIGNDTAHELLELLHAHDQEAHR